MQPGKASVPALDELRAYSLGKLPEERARVIEKFLADHPEHLATVDSAPDDDVVRHLRGSELSAKSTLGLREAATLAPDPQAPDSKAAQAATASYAAPPSSDGAEALANHPRYQLIRKLGEGGMGAVFLAEHRLMHRPVALKMIRAASLSHQQAVERFRREIQAAALLSHPNIVTAHDAEEAGGIHFLAMEYVEGVALSDWLAMHGPLPVDEACRYVRDAALGLQYAHEKGMVHRDLKPHNLMRTPAGTIKILDFGLARFAVEAGSPPSGELTGVGVVMGTADYMAPEQAHDSRHADIRADIYSLGCTIYQLLAGRVPFPEGSVIEKLVKHSMKQPESLAKLRPDLPAALVSVVGKMMAKRPGDRYQTPGEVARALLPFASPASSPRPGLSARRLGFCAAALLIGAVGLAITIRTNRGDITIQTDDPNIEVVTRGNGDLVLIRDRKANQTWNLDTKHFNLGMAQDPDGLRVDLDEKRTLVLRRRDGGKISISGPAVASEAPRSAPEANGLPRRFKNSLGMEFALIPKGKSWLGGGSGKPGDTPVEIAHDFYLGVYEVTQDEWHKVTGQTPSKFSRTGDGEKKVKNISDDELKHFPVEMVSWNDAQLFLKTLNQRDSTPGWTYRLPKAAEWEYACRGGPLSYPGESAFDYYLDRPANQLQPGQANFKHGKGYKRTCKVGSYPPNALGLHDMHGNVWEWCADEERHSDGLVTRVSKGGSWLYPAEDCRAAHIDSDTPSHRGFSLGLRLARVPVALDQLPPEEWVRPQVSTAGVLAGKLLADDSFKLTQKSLFAATKGAEARTRMAFAAGTYVMHLRSGKPDWLGWNPAGQRDDFLCQVTGRVSGQTEGAWGIYLDGTPPTRSLKVMVRGDGSVDVGTSQSARNYSAPKLGPVPALQEFHPGAFNTLAVARHGETLVVFLNGKSVGAPIILEPPLGPCACGLQGEQYGKQDVLVEFKRYTVWEIPAPLNIDGPSIAAPLDPRGSFKDASSLTSADRILSGKRYKVYSVSMERGKTYAVTMTSEQIDSYLYLLGPNKRTLAVDDDGAGDPDAKIEYRATETGTYRIVATTFDEEALGDFNLTIQRAER